MPHYIVKLSDGEKNWYLDWSTIVDAPVTAGMSLEEFKEFYQEEFGTSGMAGLVDRLTRVETKGTSSRIHSSVDNLIRYNRAGADETQLTKEQIIDYYCRRQGEGPPPEGKAIL